MKNRSLSKLQKLVGKEVAVEYVWIGIDKVASGTLLSVNKGKVVVDRPFTFSFLGRKTISFKNKSTRIKQIATAEGEVVYPS